MTKSHRFSAWFDERFKGFLDFYEGYVNKALKTPKRTLVFLLGGIALTFALIPFVGVSYFPATDSGFFIINVKAPTGTRVEVTAEEVKKIEDIIRRVAGEDVEIIVSNIGITPDFTALYTSNTASHTAFIQVNLKGERKQSTRHAIENIRPALQQEVPQLKAYFQSGGLVDAIIGQGVPAPIDIQISGLDLKDVHKLSTLIGSKISALESVQDVFIPQDIDAPSLMFDINREYASELGLNPQEIIHTLITSLTSNQMISPNYWIDPKNGNDYFLTVQYPEETVKTVQDLKGIPIHSPKRQKTVYLDAVAQIKPFVSPTVVSHYQLQRVMNLYVTPKGEDLGNVSAQINDILAQVKTSPNVRIKMQGLVESMHASFKSFGIGLLLSILLVYLLLVAQFKSFVDPFIILLAMLPGLSGVTLMLFLTGTTFNIISLMGTLMMIGVTVSNSILIVEFTRRLLGTGVPLQKAVVQACRIRLRPILMTSLATIVGLLPMSSGLSTGSETYAPLARVIIGGLGASLLISLFLIPTVCFLVYQNRPSLKHLVCLIGMSLAALTSEVRCEENAACCRSLTLNQAREMALTQHPDILSHKHSIEASRQETEQALSAYYPQIGGSAVGVAAGNNTRASAVGGLTNPLILQRGSVGLTLNQMITDFGRTPRAVDAADAKVSAQVAKSLSVRDRVIFAVTRAYYNTLLAQEVLRVANETLTLRQTLLEKIQFLAQEKLRAFFDVDIATQSVDEAKVLLIKAQNDLNDAQAELSQALGYGELMCFNLAHDIKVEPLKQELPSLLKTAKFQNHELAALREELAEKTFQYEAAEAEHYPTVNAIGYAGDNPLRNKSELKPSYAAVGVALNVPLYTGNRITAAAQQKLSEMKALQMSLVAKENTITRDVRLAWNNVQSSYQNISVSEELFLNNTKALELAQASYEFGMTSIVDLAQEQLKKTQAEISFSSARYEYLANRALLSLLLGEE